MGMFFENIHIRKNDEYDLEQLKSQLIKQMTQKGYKLISGDADGDLAVVIYEPENSEWISVVSDDFQFTTIESIKSAIEPISNLFRTDVMAAACNDSDYLMLNILNVIDKTDGWINIGSLYGVKKLRRNSVAPWKKKVIDYDSFREIIKKQYTFAEEAFYEIADLLGIQSQQVCLETDNLAHLNSGNICKLLFTAPGMEKQLPALVIPRYDGMPCKIGQSHCVFVNNQGGKSKGVGVLFVGDYVEDDEIYFENVTFESDYGSDKRKIVPIELKKVKLTNGKKAFQWEDREFVIPPAVSSDIPMMKRMDLEFKKQFGVRFVPQGNPRKVLDIMVVIYPIENSYEGQAVWYVYRWSKTKEAFIKKFNETWKNFDSRNMLNPDDFDL